MEGKMFLYSIKIILQQAKPAALKGLNTWSNTQDQYLNVWIFFNLYCI